MEYVHKSTLILLVLLACNSNDVDIPVRQSEANAIKGYADLYSARIYYEIRGAGNPLVLLHGGLGPADHFKNNIPEFEKHFKVIIVHTRGHGRSTDNSLPFSYSSFADELSGLFNYLKIDSAHIMGFSDGGIIGYHFASKYPHKVRKLIAVGANYLVEGMTEEAINWAKNNLNAKYISKNLPSIRDSFLSLNPKPENFEYYLRKTRSMWFKDPYISKEELARISNSVLLVAGDNDVIRLEHMIALHHQIKNSHLCIVPNASHDVLNERAELINKICIDFLSAN